MYIDNFGILGVTASVVSGALQRVVGHMESVGLKMHEIVDPADSMESIGVTFDGIKKQTEISSRRFWRLDLGIKRFLTRKRVSGKMLERLVGQCTFAGLANRRSLSVFHVVYKFVRKHESRRAPLWPSVRAELQAFRGILPLVLSEWQIPWCYIVVATDASETGV